MPKGVYQRKVFAGTVFDRLDLGSIPEPNSGCHIWIGDATVHGYGLLRWQGKRMYAHRLSWSAHNKQPIPDGMSICHRCDNPHCINPEHLFLGTHQENMADAVTKDRFPAGNRHWNAKLSDDDVRNIRNSNLYQHEIASLYGITQGHVSEIKSSKKRTSTGA